MKKSFVEVFKCVLFGLCVFLLSWGLLIYAGNAAGREIPHSLSLLSGFTMASVATLFFFAARNFARIEQRIHRLFDDRTYGYTLPALTIFVSSFAAGAIMWKITSVCGEAPISLPTLLIISAVPAILGTVFVCGYRVFVANEARRKYCYVGPMRGDVILFLVPTSSEDPDAPQLVLSSVSLWDCYETSRENPDIGLPEENALSMACKEVSVFMDTKKYYTRDRLAAAIRAGGWVGAMEASPRKEMISQIYRKCCDLNEDEVVSLSQEELQFLTKYGRSVKECSE